MARRDVLSLPRCNVHLPQIAIPILPAVEAHGGEQHGPAIREPSRVLTESRVSFRNRVVRNLSLRARAEIYEVELCLPSRIPTVVRARRDDGAPAVRG